MNWKRVREVMDKHGLDALIASSPENNLYVTNVKSETQVYLREVLCFSVVTRDREITAIMPLSDADVYAQKASIEGDIRFYGKFFINFSERHCKLNELEKRLITLLKKVKPEATAIDALINILKEKKLDKKKIGLDGSGLSHKTWNMIIKRLPLAEIVEASLIFKEIRSIKTEDEIEKLRKSVYITEKAINEAFTSARIGMTENELATIFCNVILENGAKPFIAIFGCGPRSAFPNALPTNYKLKYGDIIRFDGGCIYEGYYSDIARTVVLGQPSEELKKYYSAVFQGVKNAIDKVKPGAKTSEIFFAALKGVREGGIPNYKRHHCGHGIGLECYEIPAINERSSTIIENGMVINIETPYYEVGFGGVQVEETLLVTEKGVKYLSTPAEENLVTLE